MTQTDLSILEEKSLQTKTRLEDSLFSKELAPHYMSLAGKLASSELVPKSFRNKPQDLFICWAMGYQVGLTPEQSMQCIAVINGKPAMWGDDMLALCMAHKDFVDIIEEPIIENNVIVGYTCIVKRKGMIDKINIFTLAMAKKAGLLAKGGVWIQYTERMLKLRARGFSLRDAFPDALKGIKPREEVEDYVDADYKVLNDKGSRTEQLKKDLLSNKGVNDDGFNKDVADIKLREQDEQRDEPSTMESTSEKTTDLHTEIKRLCDEKVFTQERLEKALKYYETDNIGSMDDEQSKHFIAQLNKL